MILYIIYTQMTPKCMYLQSVHLPKFQTPIFICLIDPSLLREAHVQNQTSISNSPARFLKPGNGKFAL